MRKIFAALVVLTLALCLTACGQPRFESEEAMMQQLEGMWTLNLFNSTEYYVFENGKVYHTSNFFMKNKMEDLMLDTVTKQGLAGFRQLDYPAALKSLTAGGLLGPACSDIEIDYEKGRIIFFKNTEIEEHIVVWDDTAEIRDVGDNTGISLTKISDQVDLSGERFEKIFNEAKEEYAVPINALSYDTEAYGEDLKVLHPEIRNWILTDKSDESTIYTKDGSTKSDGAFIVSDDMLMLAKGSSNGNGAPFLILYQSDGTLDYDLLISDRLGASLNTVLKNAEPLLKAFPGTLTITELLNRFEQQHTVSGGSRSLEITENSFTYRIHQATTGKSTVVYITLPEEIKFSALTDFSQAENEKTQPEKTEPEKTPSVQPVPKNEVPYTTPLAGSVSIYESPDSSSTFVRTIGADGVFTIVEEANDKSGNLWGKLKSGLGWVLLKEATAVGKLTCPQCNLSEPDAIFEEGAKAGDICFGCSYDNFNVGEDGKKYCSQCGADCTYRGLEEDGRCEDCYFGN